jgi:hypothetical protein
VQYPGRAVSGIDLRLRPVSRRARAGRASPTLSPVAGAPAALQIPIADYALPAGGKIAVTERRKMPRLAAWRPDKQWRAAVRAGAGFTTILGPGPGAGEPWPWEMLDATRRCLAKRRPLPAIQPLAIPGRGGCPAAAARGHHPRLDRS